MRSIFEAISLKNKENEVWQAKYEKRLPLTEIQINQVFFPKEKDAEKITPDYKLLWEAFLNEIKFIQTASFKVFGETMLNLLEKYTSRIPSSTQHLPDVSLYDHSKTTAAFAISLYD